MGTWGLPTAHPGCPALSPALLAPAEGTDSYSDLFAFAQAIPTTRNAFPASINLQPPLPTVQRRQSYYRHRQPGSVLPLTWDGLDSGIRNLSSNTTSDSP